jgi:hypothetical protein
MTQSRRFQFPLGAAADRSPVASDRAGDRRTRTGPTRCPAAWIARVAGLVAAVGAAVALAGAFMAPSSGAWQLIPPGNGAKYRCTPSGPGTFYLVPQQGVSEAWTSELRAAAQTWNRTAKGVVSFRVVSSVDGLPKPTGIVNVKMAPGQPKSQPTLTAATEQVSCDEGGAWSYRLTILPVAEQVYSPAEQTWMLAHELGHVLGQAHPEPAAMSCVSTMWPGKPTADCLNSPMPDDLAGVISLFNPNLTPTFPANSVLSVNGKKLHASVRPSFSGGVARAADGWTFVPVPGYGERGYVVNTGSGECLRAGSDPGTGGTELVKQSLCYVRGKREPVIGTLWTVKATSQSGVIALESVRTGLCLSSQSGLEARATQVSCTTAGAKLSLTPAPSGGSTREARSLPEGGGPEGAGYAVRSQNSGFCLAGSAPSSQGEGGRITQAGCESTEAQQWLYNSATKQLSAFNGSSPACVETTGAANSLQLAACAGGPAQEWTLAPNGSIVNRSSGLCLDVPEGSSATGTEVIAYECNGGNNQSWGWPSALGEDEEGVTIASTASSSGRVLSLAAASASQPSMNFAIINESTASSSGEWWFEPTEGKSSGSLENLSTEGCLQTWSYEPPQKEIWETWTGPPSGCDANQLERQWTPVTKSNGTVTFKNGLWTNRCLDLTRAKDSNGAEVIAYPCNGQVNQQWRILPNTTAPPSEPEEGEPEPMDLALGSLASESSEYNTTGEYAAANAIDGSPVLGGAIAQTAEESSPWWQVDLLEVAEIGAITIYPGPGRLYNVWVFTSETPFNTALTPEQQSHAPGVASYHCTGSTPFTTRSITQLAGKARYVMVQRGEPGTLSLAAVEVLTGHAPVQSSSGEQPASPKKPPVTTGGGAPTIGPYMWEQIRKKEEEILRGQKI